MRLWPFHRRTPAPLQAPTPRPNPTRIAVLEHDLLGIKPTPGTAAAAAITLRQAGTCTAHDPIDISTLADGPDTKTMCGRCGQHLTRDDNTGTWRPAGS